MTEEISKEEAKKLKEAEKLQEQKLKEEEKLREEQERKDKEIELINAYAPLKASWRAKRDKVVHVFTHFELRLKVMVADVDDAPMFAQNGEGHWICIDELSNEALPSLMTKVAKLALK